jgi:hypothetical protein
VDAPPPAAAQTTPEPPPLDLTPKQPAVDATETLALHAPPTQALDAAAEAQADSQTAASPATPAPPASLTSKVEGAVATGPDDSARSAPRLTVATA